jgi:hypothetical protein
VETEVGQRRKGREVKWEKRKREEGGRQRVEREVGQRRKDSEVEWKVGMRMKMGMGW